ncbi:PREDICTED: uncharacterized protein LOC104808241 isoform X1 [Tarenaya hassleriana]|uniref:uncharacterized protein LOC104808241 isoform X1 n=1 Tax=Tarenaya hassleriana TaxID=28532 RepID=UPI00053C2A7F|nr:PREDICTED: uncharacterized protein LOC104808241 isoform X1 [Tarenaya hassleriana]
MNPSADESSSPPNLPLLLQPSYARSKSMLFDDLRNFRVSLKWCALDHSSPWGKILSYFTFVVFTILVPLVSCLSIETPNSLSSPVEDPISFNALVQFPESGLATVGFFTLICFFRKYGLRQLLFLDGLGDDSVFVRRGYSRELDKAFRYVAAILLPSFFVELVHKSIFFSSTKVSFPFMKSSCLPLNSVMFFLVLVSWVYRTGVFLLVCILFRLTCELQILRFVGLHKMFDGCGSDTIEDIYKEHTRIKKQLSATSHRYRFFIIASSVVISASQFVALLLVLASKSEKSFLNSGDLVVCSAVQLSGFFLCLLGAVRITHRAQGVVSIATRWHMTLTLASSASLDSDGRKIQDGMPESQAESDTDSSDNICITVSSSLDPTSFFQARQALVEYLRHNNKGITLYGYTLDRGLLHTLFAFEFSLVMWILSKVVVLS